MQKEERTFKKLLALFLSSIQISCVAFGGGFVVVSLMKKKYVEQLKWLSEEEMLDISAISQSSPGPILVNASVILGYRVWGVLGSVAAVIGTIIPPMVILSLISVFYDKFRENKIIATALQVMRAGVAAVIFDVVINLAKNVAKTKRILYIALMIIAFAAAVFFKVNAGIIILVCLAVGIIDLLVSVLKRGGKKNAS